MKRLETMSFRELIEYGDKLEVWMHVFVFAMIIVLIVLLVLVVMR